MRAYVVEVEGRRFEVTVGPDGLRVDGVPVAAELVGAGSGAWRSLLLDGRSVRLRAVRGEEPGSWQVEIAGRLYHVSALDPRLRALREGRRTGAGAQGGPFRLVAPMPGLIVNVEVQVGDAVRRGKGLVIMEAMKMENELRSEVEGRVGAVLVRPHQTVERGEALVVIEPPEAGSP